MDTETDSRKMNDRALEVENLQTYFRTSEGTAKAVDGVSFNLRPGETYALVGESGCGKSVTALSIMRLVAKPSGYVAGGKIVFNGKDILSVSPGRMRSIRGNRISMIFQEPMTSLNPVFTIGHQISEAIELHQGLSRTQARLKSLEMLRKTGIPDPEQRLDEYPHQMSGGMRQRVMIAMALACEPEILIADEPTTALDVTIQMQILELMRGLREEFGMAVLLITHDMGVVSENADRVGVMYAGKIVEEASRKTLFSNPAHPYTRLLLEAIPAKGKRNRPLSTIRGRVPPATDFPPGCRFSSRCPFVMGKCRKTPPPDFDIEKEHTAKCYLLESNRDSRPALKQDNAGESKSPASEMSHTPKLVLKDVKTWFPVKKGFWKRTAGWVKAVDGIDLTINEGETSALVGESGCGKTTVGKTIVNLEKATEGLITLHSAREKITETNPERFQSKIRMIFQDPFSSLNPRLMVGESIMEGMETCIPRMDPRQRQNRIAELLPRVGLAPDMIDRYPHEFSGGQRQRIGLARALAADPEALICDEAVSSLDVSVQAQILNLLKDLQQELRLSYLFITHDLSVVKYLADRVSVMYLGRIVEEGTVDEIFADARHPYTRILLSAVPKIDGSGNRKIILQGDVPSPVNPPSGCHFHPRCPFAGPECSSEYPETKSAGGSHSYRCIL